MNKAHVAKAKRSLAGIYPSPPSSPPPVEAPETKTNTDAVAVGSCPDRWSATVLEPAGGELDQLPTTATSLDLSQLKVKMSIHDGKCGSNTKTTAKPCQRNGPAKNSAKIDSFVESLLVSTNSAVQLEIQLRSLAQLVHCDKHDHSEYIESRIDTWISVMPVATDGMQHKGSLQRRIRRVFGQVPTKCAGFNKEKKPCGAKTGGQKVHNCTKTVEEIVTAVVASEEGISDGVDDVSIGHLFKVLEYNLLCRFHHEQPFKHRPEWTARLEDLRSVCHSAIKEAQGEDKDVPKNTKRSDAADASVEEHTNPTIETWRTKALKAAKLNQNPADYWTKTIDSSPFAIIEKGGGLEDGNSSSEVGEVARKPLNPKLDELKDGYLYVFGVEGNPDFVKIGYTTRDIEKRHKEWKDDYNRPPQHIYPDLKTCQIVPNARRVERLVHTELKLCNVRISCHGCQTQHIEWFEISSADAVNVVKKWSRWMAGKPYEEVNLPEGSQWMLKAAEQDKLAHVGKFLIGLSEAAEALEVR